MTTTVDDRSVYGLCDSDHSIYLVRYSKESGIHEWKAPTGESEQGSELTR